MKVLVPSPLHSYTDGRSTVEAAGATLGDVLVALDECSPGLRFRIVDEQDRVRPHINFFVGTELVRRLDHPVEPTDELMIVCALSGG
ncbi:MoaD/ThiS family protein [Vulgatibacter sp.]|uniref:MoaD/ThiS family protein n=1 Tax=Vulgatibacter sp. TaxID=1971226 RepID=UPI00356AA8AF